LLVSEESEASLEIESEEAEEEEKDRGVGNEGARKIDKHTPSISHTRTSSLEADHRVHFVSDEEDAKNDGAEDAEAEGEETGDE